MSYAMILRDDFNNITFDSRTAVGGVFADICTFGPTDTATLSYTAFPGRSVRIIPIHVNIQAGASGVSASTSAGYPVVTVTASGAPRFFAVEVY